MTIRRIYKQTLEGKDEQTIVVPRGAQFLSVQLQHNQPQIWYLCNPDNEDQDRNIKIIGTGHPIDDWETRDYRFIDTFQMLGGQLVFHVFEVLE